MGNFKQHLNSVFIFFLLHEITVWRCDATLSVPICGRALFVCSQLQMPLQWKKYEISVRSWRKTIFEVPYEFFMILKYKKLAAC